MDRDNRIVRQILDYDWELKKYHRLAIASEVYSTHMLAVEKKRADLITPVDLRIITPEDLRKKAASITASLEINLVGNLRNLLRSNAN